jgi:preprotein translocase subunit YajC
MQFAVVLADDKPAQPAEQTNPLNQLFIFAPILVLGYLLLIRPNRRAEQQRQAFLAALKKNDKVLTAAGVYGTVVSLSDKEDEVIVKVDDNARLRMTKGSITRNLTAEETVKQAKEDAKAART